MKFFCPLWFVLDESLDVHFVHKSFSRVPVPLRTLTYCEGVHYGTELDYEMMMSLYEHETVQVERERLMQALACSRDTHTLKKLIFRYI